MRDKLARRLRGVRRLLRGRTRVLYVLPRLSIGGMERVCEQICRGLDPQRFAVKVLVTEERFHPRTITSDRLVAAGLTPQLLTEPNWETRIHQVAQVVLEWGADVVLNNFCVCTKEALIWLSRHGRCPHVVEAIHGVDPKQPLHTWLPRYDALLSVSDDTTETLLQLGFPESDIVTVENGVDTTVFGGPPRPGLRAQLGLKPEHFVLGMNCRLTHQKAPELVFRSLARLRGKHPEIRLLSAGPDFRDIKPEDPDYVGMARELGVEDMIHFLGPRDDIPDLLSITDAYLSASRWEGMSVSVLEAMAAGRPIVATSTEGTERLLEDGRSGLVIGPASVENISAGIERALEMPRDAREAIGAAARRRAEDHFSLKRTVRSYEALLEDIQRVPPRPYSPDHHRDQSAQLEARQARLAVQEAHEASRHFGEARSPILVVSHDAEAPGRIISAGGMRMHCMLKVLAERHDVHLLLWNPGIWTYPASKLTEIEAEGYRVIGAENSAEAAVKALERWLDAAREAGAPPLQSVIFEYTRATGILDALRALLPGVPVIIDTHDVEAEKEAQQAAIGDLATVNEGWTPENEGERQLQACRQADRIVAISERDAELLRRYGVDKDIRIVPLLFPEKGASAKAAPKVSAAPEVCAPPRRALLFVGNTYYVPNVDAVLWFVRHVLDAVREEIPEARLVWVGELNDEMRQGVFPRELLRPDVSIEGWVPDLQPYYLHSALSICPLRVGSGQKGKVAGALRAGMPVISTSVGVAGMDLVHGRDLLVADGAEAFIDAVLSLLRDPVMARGLSNNGRARARRYDVGRHRDAILSLLDW